MSDWTTIRAGGAVTVRRVTSYRIPDQNIICATTGDRSYTMAVNVPARTVQANRVPQGSGAHTAKELQ